MKKKLSVLALVSVFAAGSAFASGWRIPEQSVDSTAKAGANIASSTRGDTAYYNPANMSWMADTWTLEGDATYLYLSPIEYKDSRNPMFHGDSESEHFIIPTGFFVSPSYGGARFGMALVAPGGLSKQWKDRYPKAFAEEFSLTILEANPTVSYGFGEMFSIAGGVRMIYSDATVKSDASGLGKPLSRSMEGDTLEWGWNAAVAYKPVDALNISATYRSNIDLEFDDKADLNLMGNLMTLDATVDVPLPAVFALSVAYDVLDNLNVELTWDRTFWSEYEVLDFDFSPPVPGNPFEVPQIRNWDDTDAFRIGLTYGVNDTVTLMGGFGYDNNPAPTENIGFELPDSNAWLYSLGMQYKVNEHMDLGIAALYDYKESRKVEVNPHDAVYGEFTNASALLVTAGINYRF
ncbi:MAG: aromatic hydrocarbon degradation protein [Desulfobulbaceae bacterium S3730MH12]|nr:MAG: aromatic hydrocarbon degradation protein [Desulfobulbaceae bacterium S3730MH12]OEU83362.1 MAG: aromatic hydrocarbon degradation protein [Desulfobulbaceae bacterium C00003063]